MHDNEKLDELPPVEGRDQPARAALRPRHCWEIVRQVPGLHYNCEECYAYFVQQDCWTLWGLRRPGFKPCCQKKGDCAECAVLVERMHPQVDERLEIEHKRPVVRPTNVATKRICNYLQLYNTGELVEGEGRSNAVMRSLQQRNADFRCRLRGVHLDMGYVSDVCVSRHVEECVFLDEPRPDVQIRQLPVINGINAAKRPLEKGTPGVGDTSAATPVPRSIMPRRER